MIHAKQISYTTNQRKLIDKVSIDLHPGEFIAIIGPNGAGKSTLLSLLSNEIEGKEAQEITLKDQKYTTWNLQKLAQHKAKFSQSQQHEIPLLVEEVVRMGRYPYYQQQPLKNDHHIVTEMLSLLEIEGLAKRPYNQLSGGEKQRVHLARVLAQLQNDHVNKTIILDEPLNNLDVAHQFKILNLLKNYATQGNVVLMVLHDINLAGTFADKILLLKNGKCLGFDKPQHILTSEIISDAYEFPCVVCSNPITNLPLILFGN